MDEPTVQASDSRATAWRVMSAIITLTGICGATWLWVACPCARIPRSWYLVVEVGFGMWFLGALMGMAGGVAERRVYLWLLVAAIFTVVMFAGSIV